MLSVKFSTIVFKCVIANTTIDNKRRCPEPIILLYVNVFQMHVLEMGLISVFSISDIADVRTKSGPFFYIVGIVKTDSTAYFVDKKLVSLHY